MILDFAYGINALLVGSDFGAPYLLYLIAQALNYFKVVRLDGAIELDRGLAIMVALKKKTEDMPCYGCKEKIQALSF